MPVEQSSKLDSKKVFFKIHRKDKTEILAICDEFLFDQELKNDTIRMKIPKNFYYGHEISRSDALQLMRKYANINILGSVLEEGIQQNLINKDAVIWLKTEDGDNIPHLLIFSIPPI